MFVVLGLIAYCAFALSADVIGEVFRAMAG
jgi:hypothetical protein